MKSIDELKKEYVILALGNLVYGIDTTQKRQEISDEIERIERKDKVK